MAKNPQVEGDGVVADRGAVGSGGEFWGKAPALALCRKTFTLPALMAEPEMKTQS